MTYTGMLVLFRNENSYTGIKCLCTDRTASRQGGMYGFNYTGIVKVAKNSSIDKASVTVSSVLLYGTIYLGVDWVSFTHFGLLESVSVLRGE